MAIPEEDKSKPTFNTEAIVVEVFETGTLFIDVVVAPLVIIQEMEYDLYIG